MKLFYSLIVYAILFSSSAIAQSGTEFWFAPPDVTFSHNSPGGVPIYLNLATFNDAATVTIDQPANALFTPIVVVLAANSSHQEDLSAYVADLETTPTNTILSTGLRVVATDTITAYYEVSNTNNADIFSLKGKASLGQEFYIPLHKHDEFYNHDTYSSPNLAYASFDIIATEDNTLVTIYSPVDVDGITALVPYSFTLQEGETYSCGNTDTALEFFPYRGSNEPKYSIPGNHPSGAVVISNKDIAITIKDDSNHNPSGGCYDLLGDQIVPVGIVGTEYIAVKGQLNATGDESVFILATENNTQVYIDGAVLPITTLFAGQTYRYDMDYLAASTDNSVYIVTSKPAYVTHVTGFGCEEGQAVLPPLGCAGSEQISINRSTAEAFYLNIMVRTGSESDFSITGPGTATINASSFQTVPGTAGLWQAAQIQFTTAEIPVNQSHLITNSSDVFTLAIVNGGASTGCRYGFFSEFAAEILLDPGVDLTICANDTANLAGSVSGGTSTGLWTSSGSGQFLPDATSLSATYVPSPADISAGAVTLTLTSTGNCTPIQDDMLLNITPAPVIDAGLDLIVCENNPLANLSSTITISSGGIWSGGAGTYTPNNTSLITAYTPTSTEITNGIVNLVVTSTGNGTCNPVTDNLEITFSNSPTVDAGATQTACGNNPDVTLTGSILGATGGIWSGGAGTFSPNVNALNAVYTASAAEISLGSVTLTLTTIGNGDCIAESDQVTINYTNSPTTNAGLTQTLCSNNADISLAGNVTIATGGVWSGGLGIFTPNNNALNATYTPTTTEIATGTLNLTLTSSGNGNCTAVIDNVVVNFTGAPTADAGIDQSVCSNNSNVNLAGIVTIAGGGIWSGGTGTYAPSNNLTSTYTPSVVEVNAGSATLTLTTTLNGNCLAETDDVLINISANPIVNAGPNLTSCANNPGVNLAGTIQNATGGQWSGGAGNFFSSSTDLNAVYTPTNAEILAGSVNLILSSTGNGACNAGTDNISINITDSPTANAGNDQTVCANNADVTLNGSVLLASGGTWSGGLGTFAPNNNTLNAVYSPTVSELATGSVNLTLTTTGSVGCNPENDVMTINFTAAPNADAGLDITVCENNPVANLAGVISIATGGIWSGGTGTFSPSSTILNATYTASSSEILNGGVMLALTTTGVGNCNVVIDSIEVVISPNPTVNAGSDQTVCVNNLNVNLSGSISGITNTGAWTSNGTGIFVPNNTSLNASYVPSVADSLNGSILLTLTSSNNGNCFAVEDNMLITILPAGFADAGSDVSVCGNNANIPLSGVISGGATSGVWSSSGTGLFTPNDSVLITNYIPSAFDIANGTVDLFLTANSCNAGMDQITITITPAPLVDAGADVTVCATNLNIPLVGTVSGASTTGIWSSLGSGSFAPSNTDLNASYIASSTDSINQTITLVLETTNIGNCISVTDTLILNIFPTGIVDAGIDQTLCANNSLTLMNATITGGATDGIWSTSGSGVFTPINTDLNAVYNPSAGDITLGSVNLILSATNSCNAASDFVNIIYTPEPIVDAGMDLSICGTNPTVNASGVVTGAGGGVWTSTGTGTFSPSNTSLVMAYTASATDISSGGVVLYLTSTGNGNCNPVTDSTFVNISTGIVVNAGIDQQICSSADFAVLQGQVMNGSSSGVWTTLGTGTFTPNDSLLNVEYNLSTSDTTSGSVQLVLTSTFNGSCASASDTVEITFGNSVFASAGSDQIICADNPMVNLNGLISGGSSSGQWFTLGSGSFNPNDTTLNGVYIPSATDSINGIVNLVLQSTNNAGCQQGVDTVSIDISPLPQVSVGSNINICSSSDSIIIQANLTNSIDGFWSTTGSGSFLPSINDQNAYYSPSTFDIAAGEVDLFFTTTGSIVCSEAVDSLKILVISPIEAGFTNTESCQKNPIQFTDTSVVSVGTINEWLWEFGDGDSSSSQSPIHIFENTGVYDVKLNLVSSLGCDFQLIKSVIVNDGPTANFKFAPTSPKIDELIEFKDQSVNAESIEWDFDDNLSTSIELNPTYTYIEAGSYEVSQIVIDDIGCVDTMVQIVNVIENNVFPPVVPSGFSPNNDGENDMLLVRGGPFTTIDLKVYNNWGNVIFESTDQTLGWDGTWKDKLMPVGDYVYTVYVVMEDGQIHELTGSISIIK